MNPNTKFQFNCIHAIRDSQMNGRTTANLFAMRAQVAFSKNECYHVNFGLEPLIDGHYHSPDLILYI